jgi:magnesium transporter
VLDALEVELEEIEKRIFSTHNNRAIIESLYLLKQKLMTLKHAAGPLLEASSKLFGGRVPQLCAGLQEYFRDVYDHLARVNQSIDSLREMVITALSVNLSLLTMQGSEVTKRLAGYAALVAVPTMIAGIYGMNFENMPELTWSLGYPLTIAIMAAMDGYLFYRLKGQVAVCPLATRETANRPRNEHRKDSRRRDGAPRISRQDDRDLSFETRAPVRLQ